MFFKSGFTLISISKTQVKCWDLKEQRCIADFKCDEGLKCVNGSVKKNVFVGSKKWKNTYI